MGRNDGRSEDQIRNVKITRPFMKFAEGSCLIELGNTKVICTASVEESVPPFLKGSGNGWVTAEYGMLPRSCQSRISRGKDSGRTYEIQRLVGRALRSVTNMRAIGERTVWLDCDVLQGDGGTRTAAITGAFIALIDSLDSIRKRGWISAIPVSDFVAATSVGIINGVPMLDLAYDEDSKADVDMNIVMTARGRFIEIQGTAERKPFTGEQMNSMLKLAQKGIGELVDIQRGVLKDVFKD